MSPTLSEGALAVAALATLLAVVAWVLGPVRRRDGVLFTGTYFVAVLAMSGIWDIVRGGPWLNGAVVLALLFALPLRHRFRAGRGNPASPG